MATEYKWETQFLTAQNLMCHILSERVKIITNIQTGLIRILKDDKEIDSIDGSDMSMSDYEKLIVITAEGAKKLQDINF